MAEEPKKQITK